MFADVQYWFSRRISGYELVYWRLAQNAIKEAQEEQKRKEKENREKMRGKEKRQKNKEGEG